MSEERAAYLRRIIAKDKSTAIHLGRVINPFGFSILKKCTPYLQSHSCGDPIPLMKNCQEIWQRVPSEAQIFAQKARPRNLGDPKAIAFANAENRPDLPSDEEFKKADTMIGEFLKPFSAELPHLVEVAGQVLAKPSRDVPTFGSKNPPRPSETSPPSSASTKVRTKKSSSKKQGELPQPSKSLILQRKSKGPQSSQPRKDLEAIRTEKRKRDDEPSVAQKKTKIVSLEGNSSTYILLFSFFFLIRNTDSSGSSSHFSSCFSDSKGGGCGSGHCC